MIKTIDTDVITDEMLYAGVYAAERCSDAGITDLKDVVYEAIFSALEVAPAVEPAQSAAGPVSKEWDSLSSIGNRLHNISVEQHYAGNEKLSDELGEFASVLWIWERTRKPTVPPAIVEPAQAVPVAHMRVMVGCRAPDDCEEYLDVCNPDDVGIDGKAFPVYREPPAIVEPARSAAEPVGYISGWINGHLVIRLLDPALALSTGTALFLQPQIVPPAIVEQIKAIKICTAWKDLVRLDDVLKILEAGNE